MQAIKISDIEKFKFKEGTYAGKTSITFKELYELPKVEVKEDKNGYWIKIKDNKYKCSKCGYYHSFSTDKIFNYCPRCGSKNKKGDKYA